MAAADRLEGEVRSTTRAPVTLPLVILATLATLATTWPLVRFVLKGGFGDPDDAMRLAEVRAWMAGQPWFDVRAMRLDPPFGSSMHWSRLVDVPNALLIQLFGLVTPRAEAWDGIVLPTLLLGAFYAGLVRLATVLLGPEAQGAALLGTVLTGVTLVQFQPGRIGHHAPETVLLVWAIACALTALEPARARQAAIAGAMVALSLALSLETLPFIGALCAAMLLVWVVRGSSQAAALRAFAGGLGVTLPLLFLASVAPRHWLAPTCDALGAAHLGAALVFAGGSLALAGSGAVLRTWQVRLLGAAALGIVAALFVALAYPACLGSPFAGVDPLVRDVWLDHVVEAQPLTVFLRERPILGLAIVLPMALGTLGCLAAATRLSGLPGVRFAIVGSLAALGLALGFWQVRVFASAAPLALCGGLFAVASLRRRLAIAGVRRAALYAAVAIVPFTATGWAIALPAASDRARSGPSCLSESALQPLATLRPGRVVAPIDAGSHLIATTPLSVFAAPYHRNNDGNRFALDVFLAEPAAAQVLLESRHVAYVMTCAGLGETARLAARAPDSFAAHLQAGDVPGFLYPVRLAGTPYRVYALAAGLGTH